MVYVVTDHKYFSKPLALTQELKQQKLQQKKFELVKYITLHRSNTERQYQDLT